jgi:predicted nucleic acid-binding Zn finger protein
MRMDGEGKWEPDPSVLGKEGKKGEKQKEENGKKEEKGQAWSLVVVGGEEYDKVLLCDVCGSDEFYGDVVRNQGRCPVCQKRISDEVMAKAKASCIQQARDDAEGEAAREEAAGVDTL